MTEIGLIEYGDFLKIDLQVATILEASEIPGADKLVKLQVDLGSEKRQIVAGIKQHYTPESLIGKQILVVANLMPRKLRGEESHGMLLAAYDESGLSLVSLDKPVAAGTKVG